MNQANPIQDAALLLQKASETGVCCSPVRELIGDSDLPSAYEVQRINNTARQESGALRVGSKIGLTSFAVQKQLGVDQPDYGSLFNDMAIEHDGTIPWAELMQGKAEAEVAFILGDDLGQNAITREELVAKIDHARVAIEIVGSRVCNWDIRITDTIADNASASHFVLGSESVALEALDLAACKMEMWSNDELVSSGTGAACMDSPLNAALWLANTMAELGEPLKKNDIILSGALGPMVTLQPGDHISTHIEGLGTVSVNIGNE